MSLSPKLQRFSMHKQRQTMLLLTMIGLVLSLIFVGCYQKHLKLLYIRGLIHMNVWFETFQVNYSTKHPIIYTNENKGSFYTIGTTKDKLTLRERRDYLPLFKKRSSALIKCWDRFLFPDQSFIDDCRPMMPSEPEIVGSIWGNIFGMYAEPVHSLENTFDLDLSCSCMSSRKLSKHHPLSGNHLAVSRVRMTHDQLVSITGIDGTTYTPDSKLWLGAKFQLLITIHHNGAFHCHTYQHFHGVEAFAAAINSLYATGDELSDAYAYLLPFAKFTLTVNQNGMKYGNGLKPINVLTSIINHTTLTNQPAGIQDETKKFYQNIPNSISRRVDWDPINGVIIDDHVKHHSLHTYIQHTMQCTTM